MAEFTIITRFLSRFPCHSPGIGRKCSLPMMMASQARLAAAAAIGSARNSRPEPDNMNWGPAFDRAPTSSRNGTSTIQCAHALDQVNVRVVENKAIVEH